MFIHGITSSMEFSSWRIISRLSCQEIPCLLYRARQRNQFKNVRFNFGTFSV
jgi:hypothetical protein